jgi:hypothetical protein
MCCHRYDLCVSVTCRLFLPTVFQQSLPLCDKRRLNPIIGLKLLQDVGHIVFDRFFCQVKLVTNLAIGITLSYQLKDRALPLVQLVDRVRIHLW